MTIHYVGTVLMSQESESEIKKWEEMYYKTRVQDGKMGQMWLVMEDCYKAKQSNGMKNISQIGPVPILLFIYMKIQQPCKHRSSESINKKISNMT